MQSATVGFMHGEKKLGLWLAHASIVNYLTQPRTSDASKFHFSRLEAKQMFAQTCLIYLLDPPLLEVTMGYW